MVSVGHGGAGGLPEPAAPDAAIYEGRRLGRYRLRYRLARGGMGTVYLASTEGPAGFGKWFAVKLMHPHLADARELVARFHDEARVASSIHHPNVCSVIDFGQEPDGLLYLVLEYLHGEALSAILQKCSGRVPWWLACHAVIDAARGLHAAHELRDRDGRFLALVHRDVSPQNLFVLYDGPCKILDFGVARIRDQITTTEEGQLRGKIPYMSPEQIEALPLDRRSDVWALGVVLWEAITGARLFKRERAMDSMRAILAEPIPRLAAVLPGMPVELDAIVARALERRAEDRQATAAALADELASCLHRCGERADHARVAGWMKEQFAPEIAAREAALRAPEPERASLTDLVTPAPSWSGPNAPMPFDAGTHPGHVHAAELHGVAQASHEPTAPDPGAATEVVALPGEPTLRSSVGHPTRVPSIRRRAIGAFVVAGAVGTAVMFVRLYDDETGRPPLATTTSPSDSDAPVPIVGVSGEADRAPVLEPPPSSEPAPASRVEPPPEPPPALPREEPPASAGEPTPPSVSTPEVAAERAPTAAPGRLDLIVIPEAVVSWRGRRLGRTPLSTTLPPGRQTLRLETDEGRVESITVLVRSGERVARNHRIGS